MIDTFDASVELAGRLLLHQGRISLEEIQHVPFVEGKQEALAVAQNLIDKYEVEVVKNTWNGEITLYLHTSTAKGGRTGSRHRKPHLRRTAAI